MHAMGLHRRLLLASLAGISLLHLNACQRPEPLVRVAHNSWVGYAPLFLAREMGYFDKANLRLLELTSSSAGLMSLASGQAEAAALTLDEFLVAREGQLDLRVIMVFDESAGADVVMARPNITNLEQLRGRRIGVENTATGALMLSRTLETAGLRPDDVVKVPVVGPMLVRSYIQNNVDAVVCFEPYATHLAKLGANRLIDSRLFPGVIVDVLVARQSALAASPEQFRRLVSGYFQALVMMQQTPTQAAKVMGSALGISPPELTAAIEGVHMMTLADNRMLLDDTSAGLRAIAQSLSALMLRSKLLRTSPSLEGLADPRFLPVS